MWTYSQRSGVLSQDGVAAGTGYSGHGAGKNNPDDHKSNEGPIPRGAYTIGEPFNSPTHGPQCMRLTPDPENEMFGRAGFLMHGDSIAHPGEASLGCIIQQMTIRLRVSNSGDNRLTVAE